MQETIASRRTRVVMILAMIQICVTLLALIAGAAADGGVASAQEAHGGIFRVKMGGPPDMMMFGPGPMGGGGPMGDGPAMSFPLLFAAGNLTSEQQTKVDAIMSGHRQTFHDLFRQLRSANDELATKLFAPGNLQTADLDAQVQKITQIREKLVREGLNVALEVRALLRTDQLQKASEVRAKLEQLEAEKRSILGIPN